MTTNILSGRINEAFVVKETTEGTLEVPVAADAVKVAGDAMGEQASPFIESPEKANTLDRLEMFRTAYGAATWNIPMLFSPGTSLGDDPMGDPLFESLFGTKTVNASTSVVYSPAMAAPSVSVWIKLDEYVVAISGAAVDSLKFGIDRNGYVMCDFAGQGMKMVYGGQTTVGVEATSAATSITVANGQLLSVGIYIQNTTKSDTNSGAGYKITAISGNVITVDTGIDVTWEVADVVEPLWLTADYSGYAAINDDYLGTCSIDSVNAPILPTDITISCPKTYLDQERGYEYPTAFTEGARVIDATFPLNMRNTDISYVYKAKQNSTYPVNVVFGYQSPGKATLALPYCRLGDPVIKGEVPNAKMDLPISAIGSGAGENSVSLTIT